MKFSRTLLGVITMTLFFGTSCGGPGSTATVDKEAQKSTATTRTVVDKGYVFVGERPELLESTELPGGYAYNRHVFFGDIYPENPDSPLMNSREEGTTSILFKPRTPGEGMNPDNIVYQYSTFEITTENGDKIFIWAEFKPPGRPTLWVKAASGQLEGLTGVGHWFWLWPDDWEKPELPEGFDYPNAYDFVFEIPTKEEKS